MASVAGVGLRFAARPLLRQDDSQVLAPSSTFPSNEPPAENNFEAESYLESLVLNCANADLAQVEKLARQLASTSGRK